MTSRAGSSTAYSEASGKLNNVDLYAVIGNPVAHSSSPLIHAAFARQTGQGMRYVAILAPEDAFAANVESFAQRGGKGLNVTVPFKLEACKLAHRLTERAEAAQAVNTLAFGHDGILGDNTDGAGLVGDIASNLQFPLQAARILLMGAGGAARGALLPLLEQRPRMLTIVNRTRSRANQLQERFSPMERNFVRLYRYSRPAVRSRHQLYLCQPQGGTSCPAPGHICQKRLGL